MKRLHRAARIGAGLIALGFGGVASSAAATEPSPGALPSLAGRWALVQVQTSKADVPIVGSVTNRLVSLSIVDVVQQGASLTLRQDVCDVRVRSTASQVRTVIPRALQQAASGHTWTARLEPGADGVRFVGAESFQVLGATLADPVRDALPSDSGDARVSDDDSDGKPGVTVRVEGLLDGEIYLAQRSRTVHRTVLRGRSEPDRPSEVSGRIEWTTEQRVLDSTSAFLRKQPPSAPIADESIFRMTRMEPGEGCAEAHDRARSLTGSAPGRAEAP